MDSIVLNFEHISEIFDAKVIALHQEQARPIFELEKWKLDLSSVEQIMKKKHQIHPSVASIG
jgi:hypothetical protein